VAGFFVAFEGPEGAGKTTQIVLLSERLRAEGHAVTVTREPGGTPLGERIRALLLDPAGVEIHARAEALLHNAARAQHVEAVIRPALERGEVVICDRFLDSTLAYQGGGRGLDLAALRGVQAFAVDGCEPRLRVLLDLPVEIGLARRCRMDAEALGFHERVRATFAALAAASPESWIVVDAARDPEAVAAEIAAKVSGILERRPAAAS
jgi:dTMP kinase